MLLFNSHLKLFLGKLKSRWLIPFTDKKVSPYDAIELMGNDGRTFCVNDQKLKPYHGEEGRRIESILLAEPK